MVTNAREAKANAPPKDEHLPRQARRHERVRCTCAASSRRAPRASACWDLDWDLELRDCVEGVAHLDAQHVLAGRGEMGGGPHRAEEGGPRGVVVAVAVEV